MPDYVTYKCRVKNRSRNNVGRARAPGIRLCSSSGIRLYAGQCADSDQLADIFQLWASFALDWSRALGIILAFGCHTFTGSHALAHNLCNQLVALFPCSEARVPILSRVTCRWFSRWGLKMGAGNSFALGGVDNCLWHQWWPNDRGTFPASSLPHVEGICPHSGVLAGHGVTDRHPQLFLGAFFSLAT